MKDRNFYEYKKRQQIQNELFKERIFSEKRDTQYLSEQKNAELCTIPDETIILIKKFDSFNSTARQTSQKEYNELDVCVPLFHSVASDPLYNNGKPTLLYALTNGTAYTVKNGNIYIWYKPWKGFEGAGFYKLNRFVFIEHGQLLIKYFLNKNEKL